MWEYLKFWLAKEFAPLLIILGLVALFGFLYGLAWIADTVRPWMKRR